MRSDLATPVRGAFFYTVLIVALFLRSMLIHGLGLWGTALTQLAIFAGVTIAYAAYYEKRPLTEVFRVRGLSLTGVIKSVFLGLLAWALVVLMGSLLQFLIEKMGGHIPELYQDLSRASFPVALAVGAILPAFCEELAFRGYILGRLSHLGGRTAILLTGILFGAMHMTTIRLIPLAVLGVIFSTAVQRTGSILPSVIMHFINNGVVLVLSMLVDPKMMNGVTLDSTQPSGGLIASTLVGIVALGWAVWALVGTFGPHDLARPPEQPDQVPPPEQRLPLKMALVPLIPAAVIFVLFGMVSELTQVFR